eukprot:s1880_g15.t1
MELLAGAFVPGGSSSLMQEIQKQLTSARRADMRLRKLKEEQETRTQHWKAYEADMQRKFSKQKRFFETDLERIAQEVQQAAAQGQQAAQNVKDLVNLGKIAETEPMEDEDDAWATLVREDEEDAQDSYLGAALRAAHQNGTASTDARQSGLAGPSGAMMGPDPFATQWQTCWWAAWHGDPYIQSPSGAYQKRLAPTSPRVSPYEAAKPDPLKLEGCPVWTLWYGSDQCQVSREKGTPALWSWTGASYTGVPTEGSSKPFPATFLEDDEELDKADGPGDPGGCNKGS